MQNLNETPWVNVHVQCPYDFVHINIEDYNLELWDVPASFKFYLLKFILNKNLIPVICPNPDCPGKIFLFNKKTKTAKKIVYDSTLMQVFLKNVEKIRATLYEQHELSPVVSFDYDDTIMFHDNDENITIPNTRIINIIKEYKRKGFKVIIVTTRYQKWEQETIDELKLHNIYNLFDGIYFTNFAWKRNSLKRLNVIIHYDDNPDELKKLKHTNIKAIWVRDREHVQF